MCSSNCGYIVVLSYFPLKVGTRKTSQGKKIETSKDALNQNWIYKKNCEAGGNRLQIKYT